MPGDETLCNFLTLPQEIQISILSKLALHDISAATKVSRLLHQLVRNTPTLQYPIELVAYGMCDNPRSTTALTERLDRLRQHDQAWQTLSWANYVGLTVPLMGGVRSRQGLMLVAKDRYPESGVDVHQLPARTRNIPHRVWKIAPGHDEDLHGQGEIYEAEDHTAALRKFRISDSGVGGNYRGSFTGAFVRRNWVYLFDQKFEIYNWKTGQRAMQLSRFSMLDECAFVGGDRHLATLCVGVGPSHAGLLVFELPQLDPAVPLVYPENTPALAFLLPEIEDNQENQTHWELVGGSAHSSVDSDLASGGDFTTDRDDTLLMILFRIEPHQWFELGVSTQRLLHFLPHPGEVSMSANMLALREVPWPEWGPQNTRVRRIPARQDGQDRDKLQATLFGMRRVWRHPVHTPAGQMAARVEDYHPRRVRRAEAHESNAHMVHHGVLAVGGWLGGAELQTELAFVQIDVVIPEKWQSKQLDDVDISINEDGIIITSQEDGEEYDEASTL
ncbi:hypothetical protein PENSPDRAFT_734124 [Peniophora sp. CONT]|nr:hypothetical protein PENSPDRAFT_734124 [Peniophora sp. CONT]